MHLMHVSENWICCKYSISGIEKSSYKSGVTVYPTQMQKRAIIKYDMSFWKLL